MTRSEIWRLEKYLRNLFRLDTITLLERPQSDSVEVHVAGEFIGLIFKDEEDGEISYASPAAATVLDVAPEAVPGSAAMALLGVDNQAAMRLFLERLSSQRPLQAGLEVDLKCASGPKSLHILASDQRANPLLEGIVLTLRDVTEQRTLEREILRIAQRERRRLCGGLHEGVGQELAGISLLLKSLANSRGRGRRLAQACARTHRASRQRDHGRDQGAGARHCTAPGRSRLARVGTQGPGRGIERAESMPGAFRRR